MVPPKHSNNMKVATQTDQRKKIYRCCCTIKPTQTYPLWHTTEGGHLHILIPKTTKQPKLPAPRLPVPADEQTMECLHVHKRGRFSIQVCGPAVPCGGKNSHKAISSSTIQDLGAGWVSAAWALIAQWNLWDSPGLEARIFTQSKGSRVSCSEHHPNWWLKFCLKLYSLVTAPGYAGFESDSLSKFIPFPSYRKAVK